MLCFLNADKSALDRDKTGIRIIGKKIAYNYARKYLSRIFLFTFLPQGIQRTKQKLKVAELF